MNSVARAWCCAVALSLLVPAIAGAQDRRNPFAELFGRLPEPQGGDETTLDFRTTTGVQWAQILQKDDATGDGDVPEGLAGGADAQLALNHVGGWLQTTAYARTAYQEYRREPAFGAPAYEAGGRVSMRATRRLSIDAGGHYARSPFFQLLEPSPFVFGEVTASGDPFIAYLIDNDSIQGSAGIIADYTKRSSLSLSGTWRETHFSLSPNDNFSARGFRGQWRRRMSRDLGVHVAYARDEVRQRRLGDSRFMNELFDIGIDYATALPIARRTRFSFATETSALREDKGKRHFRLNGTAELAQGFKRTWRASLGAFRATDFLPGFAAPVFSDTLHAGISGYLSKRFIFYGNLNGMESRIGFDDRDTYRTYSGDTRLTFAMSRHIGLFGQYVYYHYQLPPMVDSVVRLPRLSRQAYSIGIQTWVPLVNKGKGDS